MQLTELLNSIKVIQVTGDVQRKDISGIYYDSRKVIPNSIFTAIKGFSTDGHKFILDAINKGAIAIILEDPKVLPDDIFGMAKIAKIVVEDSRKALAEISHCFYKEPSKKLKLIGITGTNGKTTTSYYIKSILENAGYKVGLIGTIANYIGEERIDSSLTTPESCNLNSLLMNMANRGSEFAVMEVSSHSLVLKRVYGLHFAAAIFTNITSDHLDFHNSFQEYFDAKKILFDSLSKNSVCIYNSDDNNGREIVKDCIAHKYSYGTTEGSEFLLNNIFFDLNGTRFTINHNDKNYELQTSLIGEFNAYNAACAYATTVKLGIESNCAIEGILKTKQVPGRFEVIGRGSKKAIVDYSHTADSLEKALINLRKIVGKNTAIYTVFGCGGNRDKSKRPIMGKIASELSDFVIITNDNPRFENPSEIVSDIVKAVVKNNFKIIENREEAIKYAIDRAEDNSAILIAGKGHEDYQIVDGVKNHFSDKETAEKYLL
jgi:UDP-N-acetylmuramoyl-L-alanyl-D-glutamate--2,6-diaminopimelate ligase